MHDTESPTHRSGFTLLELIVVIAVIATLASIVGPAVFQNVSDARINAARSQIEVFVLGLESYRLHTGGYPMTEHGLNALREAPGPDDPAGWRGPYLRRPVPLDPWGRPYVYRSADPDSYELYTLGRSGQPGGEGEDADITASGEAVAR